MDIKELCLKFVEKGEPVSLDEIASMRILASVLKESLDVYVKDLDESLKETLTEKCEWKNEEMGRILKFSFKKTSVIDPKIVNELTDEECRKGFTVTAKAIEQSGRKDLLDKYKSVTESKTLTLSRLKD
jgi:hypothetical protein